MRLALILIGLVWALTLSATDFAPCHSQALQTPTQLGGYQCYLDFARQNQAWVESERQLAALGDLDETRAGSLLYLAEIRADYGGSEVVTLYQQAAELFALDKHIHGEVAARIGLVYELLKRNRTTEAESEANAAAAVVTVDEPGLFVRAIVGKAAVANAKEDLSRAFALTKQAEAVAVPESAYRARTELLRMLGTLQWAQGEYGLARDYFAQAKDVAFLANQDYVAALFAYSEAHMEANLLGARGFSNFDALAPVRKALEHALETANVAAELRCRLVLGQEFSDVEASINQFGLAIKLAKQLNDVERELFAHRYYAYALMRRPQPDAEKILSSLHSSVEAAQASKDLGSIIRSWIGYTTAAWHLGEEDNALAAAIKAMDALEQGRSLQALDDIRAGWQSGFDFFYKRVSGWLLQRAQESIPSSGSDLELALQTIERARARVLLEHVSLRLAAERPELQNRVASGIAAIQRKLRDPKLLAGTRLDLLHRLGELESDERSAQLSQAAQHNYAIPGTSDGKFSLKMLRQSLAEDEAVLSFQLWHRDPIHGFFAPDGGSWMVLITHTNLTIHPLPDMREIESALDIFLGLIGRGDGTEQAVATQLASLLFGDALDSLPDNTKRLVLVLDPKLENAPLGVLPMPATTKRLADRYELSRSPSLSAFIAQRHTQYPVHPIPVLAIADPANAYSGEGSDIGIRSALMSLGEVLDPLPFARTEGEYIVQLLGGGSVLRAGEEASESWLKGVDLSRFSVLHFGAHVVADEQTPGRSSVVLVPGDELQDGLLQPRDLHELNLQGQLVVLAACQSAAGKVVAGEGVMGISRAFLLAGARTVVASLWPLQDDLTAEFFKQFYDHLAQGENVSSALRNAKQAFWKKGAPTAGWGGLIVAGDGTLMPFETHLPN